MQGVISFKPAPFAIISRKWFQHRYAQYLHQYHKLCSNPRKTYPPERFAPFRIYIHHLFKLHQRAHGITPTTISSKYSLSLKVSSAVRQNLVLAKKPRLLSAFSLIFNSKIAKHGYKWSRYMFHLWIARSPASNRYIYPCFAHQMMISMA